jgi:hypothetical protein
LLTARVPPSIPSEAALMDISGFYDVRACLLEPEESLDFEQTGFDRDEGYPPPELALEFGGWGLSAHS